MSGIYISGVKMPEKDQLVIFRIWGNGQVERLEGYRPFLLYGVKATDIPNHGRLIDADALIADGWDLVKMASEEYNGKHRTYLISKELDDIPTIIPAEEGE